MGEQRYYFNPGRQVNIRKFLINPEGEVDAVPGNSGAYARVALDLHKLGKYNFEDD